MARWSSVKPSRPAPVSSQDSNRTRFSSSQSAVALSFLPPPGQALWMPCGSMAKSPAALPTAPLREHCQPHCKTGTSPEHRQSLETGTGARGHSSWRRGLWTTKTQPAGLQRKNSRSHLSFKALMGSRPQAGQEPPSTHTKKPEGASAPPGLQTDARHDRVKLSLSPARLPVSQRIQVSNGRRTQPVINAITPDC